VAAPDDRCGVAGELLREKKSRRSNGAEESTATRERAWDRVTGSKGQTRCAEEHLDQLRFENREKEGGFNKKKKYKEKKAK